MAYCSTVEGCFFADNDFGVSSRLVHSKYGALLEVFDSIDYHYDSPISYHPFYFERARYGDLSDCDYNFQKFDFLFQCVITIDLSVSGLKERATRRRMLACVTL